MSIDTASCGSTSKRCRTFPDEFPEGLKPRLRLFLSVDMVGSTAYKQSQNAWRPEILSFYSRFDHIFQVRYRAFTGIEHRYGPAPEFWKSNGDELLYVCELQGLEHAQTVMHVWLSALEEYRATDCEDTRHLDVKSTAWIGLFPQPNSEIFFRRDNRPIQSRDPVLGQSDMRDEWYANPGNTTITRDFVGPSIDTGFRLTAWATPDRMVLSVDLAYLLTGGYARGVGPLKLHVGGRERLKGVIDGQPYPALWIPVGGRASISRDTNPANYAATDRRMIRSHCEAVIEQNYQSITPLHLAGARFDDFDWVPPYILNRILKAWHDDVRYRAESVSIARVA